MCEDERNRELEKANELIYSTAMKSEFRSKLDDLFGKAIDQYIDECHSFPIGVGRCLEYVREYVKKNI